jgi:hypothetical protein
MATQKLSSGDSVSMTDLSRLEPVTLWGSDIYNYSPTSGIGDTSTRVTSPSSSISTSTWTPTGDRPTLAPASTVNLPGMPDLPEFQAPKMGDIPDYVALEWSEEEIDALTQKKAASGIRTLRDAVQTSMATVRQSSDNPNAQRLTLKAALAGYGTGLESVMSGASTAATQEYSQKYSIKAQEAQINHQTAVQAIRDVYSGELTAASANFNAKVEAVKAVYGAETAAAIQQAAVENDRTIAEYNNLMNEYFNTGTKTATQVNSGETTTVTKGTGASSASTTDSARQNRISQLLSLIQSKAGVVNKPESVVSQLNSAYAELKSLGYMV